MVVEGVVAALRFLPSAWRGGWRSMLPALLGLLLGLLGLQLRGHSIAALLFFPALIVTQVVLSSGALYRLALGDDGARRWPRLGRTEGRLALAWSLSAVFLFVLGLLLFVVVLCAAYGVASAGAGFAGSDIATWAPAVDARGRWIVSLIFVVGALALAWAAARVSLSSATTVAERRVAMLSTWPATRGRAWTIVASRLAASLPAFAPLVAACLLVPGPHPSVMGSAAVACLAALLFAGLWLPMQVGLMVYFYDHRVPVPGAP